MAIPLPMIARIFLRALKRLSREGIVTLIGTGARAARTAQTLNSGIRLVGSSAGMVRMLAALFPPSETARTACQGGCRG